MIQATLAREALSSHNALMAATTWSNAEEINPIMVIILKLKNAKNELLIHSLR
jgi:hypothetical protein